MARSDNMNFSSLVEAIPQVHRHSAVQMTRTVNMGLTTRKWILGWCIPKENNTAMTEPVIGHVRWKRCRDSPEGS